MCTSRKEVHLSRARRGGGASGPAGRLDRIDAAAGMITIDQQVIIVDRRPVLTPPKTSASFRDVPMPRFVLDAVIDHAEQFGLSDDDVLCRTPRGTLLRRDYYNRQIWKPAVTAAGLGMASLRGQWPAVSLPGGARCGVSWRVRDDAFGNVWPCSTGITTRITTGCCCARCRSAAGGCWMSAAVPERSRPSLPSDVFMSMPSIAPQR